MKIFVCALLMVAVGANALPTLFETDVSDVREERLVTNNIRRAIEQLARDIKDAGLDPFEIERHVINESIVPILVTVNVVIENLRFTGLSNIAINRMDYGALTNRLRFDVSLPKLGLTVGNVAVNANVFGTRYTGSLKGNLEIVQTRLIGDIRVSIGIISGISLRSVAVNFRVQNIQSDFGLTFQGEDYSDQLNEIFNVVIPEYLLTNQDEIDKKLSDFIKEVGNDALGRSIFTGEEVLIA